MPRCFSARASVYSRRCGKSRASLRHFFIDDAREHVPSGHATSKIKENFVFRKNYWPSLLLKCERRTVAFAFRVKETPSAIDVDNHSGIERLDLNLVLRMSDFPDVDARVNFGGYL